MSNNWTVIRNPRASSGKGEKRWPQIARALREAGLSFEEIVTEYPRHAIELCREAIGAGARRIIAVGGDGTANEVANGILDQQTVDPLEVRMAQVPIGTGNDWGKTVGIPANYIQAARLIAEGPEIVQDVGRVEYEADGRRAHRYFINIAGMGYDALVGMKANERKARGNGGMLAYVSTVLSCLSQYKCPDLSFTVDAQVHPPEKVFYLLVGICRYNGAGMKHCPTACYDDGLLDITVIREMSKVRSVTNLPRLFNGSFIHLNEVSQYTGERVSVQSHPPALLEVDGEFLGQSPADFSLLPRQLRVIGRGLKSSK